MLELISDRMRTIAGALAITMLAATAPVQAETNRAVEGNTAFAVDIFSKTSPRGEEKNTFSSPFSMSAALAMTYGGARGDTASQIAKVFHFDRAGAALHESFGALQQMLNKIQERGDVKLAIANSIWPEEKYQFLSGYLDLVKKHYGAELTALSFSRDAEGARKTVNDWVEKHTAEKIKELFKEGTITGDTRLVLANAIYFKGNWKTMFEKEMTRPATFHRLGGKSSKPQMMNMSGTFNYKKMEGLQVIELPYKGDALSMVVLLPDANDGIKQLQEQLTPAKLAEWTSDLYKTEDIQLSLPRWKVEAELDLNGTLAEMGMKDAFDSSKADFSGLDGTKALSITKVVHKAFIEVNEEGSEAAAATGVSIGLESVQITPVFNCDHPFVYMIRENSTGSVLFLGRMMDPAQ